MDARRRMPRARRSSSEGCHIYLNLMRNRLNRLAGQANRHDHCHLLTLLARSYYYYCHFSTLTRPNDLEAVPVFASVSSVPSAGLFI